jgi:hypothetical protein
MQVYFRFQFCLALLLLPVTYAVAQTSPAPAPATQSTSVSVLTFDGGTRQTLESIFIPPLAHAPFSLTLETEWIRPLGNGGTYTLVNKRQIMRDSAGRIYQERWLLVPKNGKMESKMNYIQISDPAEHTLYNCETATKQCYLLRYSGSTEATYLPALIKPGPLPDGSGYTTHENLGGNTFHGFDTVGYRDTTTVNPNVFGNDQPMVTTREFWYSKELGINLLSTLDSPSVGKEQFAATNVNTSEPDRRYFGVPDGYTIIDERKTGPPAR